MHKFPRVLILDERDERRERLANMASRFGCLRIDPLAMIPREEFESGIYDMALVHYNNDEGPFIEEGWMSPNTQIVLFSGGFREPFTEEDGIFYVSARFIEDEVNLKRVLERVLDS
jgi:hypothetical protein